MYIVIFRAEIAELDEEYFSLAPNLREVAIHEFGCVEFHAVSENGFEVALSYWNSQDDIRKWREHSLHKYAQSLGYKKWYSAVRVEITELLHGYSNKQHL
ncbi:MAG: antibiotic biosynthesis monooxygenase [Gammaproteobacteria bacterium]|nr:antibiotic biosynthesis monooxygenase [Gammaproteobacteria bacterium]MCP5195379.1 antibiotic biosynthesis monooxygenase [Gammaproteobacteria bacterium]